jgi:hypothetical protein
VDLQLGGPDALSNMNPRDLSVNRSLGSPIGWQLRDVPCGHMRDQRDDLLIGD